VTTVILGTCTCCRKQPAEWQGVNASRGMMDLCHPCYEELRAIYQRHPASTKTGKRCNRDYRTIEAETIDWVASKRPAHPVSADAMFIECDLSALSEA
jgi:hypothetical protein